MQKLRTSDLSKVESFVRENAPELETAELSIRRSAGEYIVQVYSTDEPPMA